MLAIGRNLALLAAVAAVLALADTHADVVDLFASMTAALADDNTTGFMAAFDRNMPGYDKLNNDISGLIGEAEITTNVEFIKDEGDESKRSADLDWTLRIRSRQMSGPMVDREQTVHVELVKQKKHWRIMSLSPLEFFAPEKFSLSK